MMGGKDKVCPRCGKKIPSSEDYCLECSGAVFIDEDKQRILDREYRVRKADSRAKMASILAGLYSAVCIIGGALAVISTDTVVSLMKCFFSNDQWIYVMEQIGVATEKELKELLVKQGADLLVAGVKERFLAYKLGVAFCDFNHDRTSTFEGFDGIVNFAREVDITINSPVWNLPVERDSKTPIRMEAGTEIGTEIQAEIGMDRTKIGMEIGTEIRRDQGSVVDAGGETVV